MTISSILPVERILPELAARDRWAAIEELVAVLERTGGVTDALRPAVLAALYDREQSMSTGIGYGVAIPHATVDGIPGVLAAFGRSHAGIDFEALDNAPVHYVVLFLVPREQFQVHLRTLAAIARFLNDRTIRGSLDAAATAEDLYAAFDKPPRPRP